MQVNRAHLIQLKPTKLQEQAFLKACGTARFTYNWALSRKLKGSKNWIKAVNKLRKLYYRISCVRNDNIHKATTHIAKNHSTVVVETLNVTGMLKNSKLARAISDCGWYNFKQQLMYKCRKLVEAPRFYPSSKTCSRCGNIKDVLLSERTYNVQAAVSA